jgi:mevalonate kinase
MQISSAGSYFASVPSTPSAGASGANAASALADGDASGGDSVVQDFLNYAKMDPIQRLRANILKSMGLTQDDLNKMTPAQQQAVEQKIEQLVKEELQKNADKTGQLVDLSA